MEKGVNSSPGMEAGTRGIEDLARLTEQQTTKMAEQLKQQSIFMKTWEEQQRINNIMLKGENMGACPKMMNDQTLESWVEEVRLWSRQSPEPELSSLKYLSFVNSVRESNRREMKKFVEIAVMENVEFAKTESDSIDKIMDLVVKTLGKSNLENASKVWKDFVELEQSKDESIRDFVLRFENTESELRNARLPIPSTALAMQILMKSNLSTM